MRTKPRTLPVRTKTTESDTGFSRITKYDQYSRHPSESQQPQNIALGQRLDAKTAETGGHFSFCWYICWYGLFQSFNKYNKYSILRLQCVSRSEYNVTHRKAPACLGLGLFLYQHQPSMSVSCATSRWFCSIVPMVIRKNGWIFGLLKCRTIIPAARKRVARSSPA